MSDKSKVCTTCGVDKPLSAYNNDKRGRLGKQARCKVCKSAKDKAYRDTLFGPEVEARDTDKSSDQRSDNTYSGKVGYSSGSLKYTGLSGGYGREEDGQSKEGDGGVQGAVTE